MPFIDDAHRIAGTTCSAATNGIPSVLHRIVVLNRRAVLGGLAATGTITASRADLAPFAEAWRSFKSRFLSDDGRIVDNGSGGVSHSEGQGWGMLFAVAAQDQASFDAIRNWTTRVLQRPTDALYAWRYVPNNQPSVQDLNNAVDGDMFIATALIRAGRLWARPDLLRAAAATGRDILRLLQRTVGPFTVLLPGVDGFENTDAVIVNPSYYAFPMMNELAGIVPSLQWDRLQTDGRTLIERGRFGPWSLPPDWLRISKVDASLAPAPDWPPRFSFDAVRVPLWWTWQKIPPGPAIHAVDRFWSTSPTPAWVDLRTNEVAPYNATPGVIAILRLMRLAAGGTDLAPGPTVADTADYYNAALIFLAMIAEQEMLSP